MRDREQRNRLLPGIGILAVAAAVAIGCSETVTGTPQAGPGATGASRSPNAPTTVTLTPTLVPRIPSSPTVPTRTTGAAPTETGGSTPAGLDTTCGEYTEMSESQQRAVITAIGAENVLVERNPELWISLASALCTLAGPDTTVREVLNGQGMR